ncbi:hypothetical protein H5410_013542, partial [Solanum commersonii]
MSPKGLQPRLMFQKHLKGEVLDQRVDRKVVRRSRLTVPKRGRKTRVTQLIAGGIGLTWVQLERVNPSPSPTHSARESEWAKAEVLLKAATWCTRETELIR